MAQEGKLSVHYAPFECFNPSARLIIVGITPGETQAAEALVAAQSQLAAGASNDMVLSHAKRVGAFTGPLRKNLVAMLDHVGFNRWAWVRTADQFFESGFGCDANRARGLIQTASVLQNPTFVDGKRYNGTPKLLGSPLLKSMVLAHFVPMAQALPEAKIVALGDVPWHTLNWLADNGHIDRARLLGQLPHPSPASQERINWFLGRPNPSKPVSKKTDTAKLDAMRDQLRAAVAQLPILKGRV